MSDVYLTLADGFEKLAAGYRALAAQDVGVQPKSRDGKTREVKALLMKYDAGKLSGVKPEDYAALLAEAEGL